MSTEALVDGVRLLAERFRERESCAPDAYPEENLSELKQLGVLNAPFPPALGGCSAGLPALVTLMEALAEASGSTALVVSMPLGLAGISALGEDIAPDEHRRA